MIRERNPVATIVRVVHKSQCLAGKKALDLVVLDDDSIPGDTICLLQQKERFIGVVDDIHKKTKIE